MNKLRWRLLLIISLLIIFNAGCTEKPEHSNPFDPLSDGYSGIGNIAGAVVVETGGNLLSIKTIVGAEIIATQNGERKGSAVTTVNVNANGDNFMITNLLAGSYDLTVSAVGYKTRIIKGIIVANSQTTENYIYMAKE